MKCPTDSGGQVGHEDFDGGVRQRYLWGVMEFCAIKSGAVKRERSRRVWNELWGSGDIE